MTEPVPVLRRVVLLALGLVAATASHAGPLEPSKEHLLRRTLNGAPYRLFVPATDRGKTALPLVLFLHGGAGRGRDNERHLLGGNGMLVEMFAAAEREFPAFVVAPQTASEHGVESTVAILEDVRSRHRVDPTGSAAPAASTDA